jgi:hypothetical protein
VRGTQFEVTGNHSELVFPLMIAKIYLVRRVGGREASLAGHGQEARNRMCIYVKAARRPYAV